jgi:diguanylate cyclase (GGDEF)-like protein
MTQPPARPLAPASWRRLWAIRDPELTDAGDAGELLVARARLAFAALILAVPLVSLAREPERAEHLVGVVAASLTTALSALVLVAVRRGWRPRWLGFATCLYDVTAVSCVLASFLLVGPPHMAINSRVTFEIYFLALAATCLRYDRRVCMITGLVAAGQYAAIVWFAARHWQLNGPMFAPYPYGMFSAGDQVGRVILLVLATLLSVTLVDRTERLRVLSTHDGLTDLYNRAYFDERIVEEVLRSRRYGHPLSLSLLDVDRFKQVNDVYGHVAGDVMLRRFADILRESVRRTDIVARFGGEEFAIIFPETTGEDALAKLERLRERIEHTPIELPRGGAHLQLTFSAGVSSVSVDGERADELIARADARLLAAKAGGRNRVIGPERSCERSA